MIPEEELKRMREELVRKAEAMRRSGRNVAEKIPGDPASIGLLRMDDDDSGRYKPEVSCPGNMLPASRKQHNALTLEECAKERLREERKIRDEEGRIRDEEVEMRVREDLIYELIVDYFKRNPRDSVFKSKRFTNIDKIYLIEKLQEHGLAYDVEQFKEVMAIGRKVRDRREKSKKWLRFPALNNFDYEELLHELIMVGEELGDDRLKALSPTLMRIVEEAQANKTDYPGRRAPYWKLEGAANWRFQRLCMLDEILYTAEYDLTAAEIMDKIREYWDKKVGGDEIECGELTATALAADFQILSDLISVGMSGSDHRQGGKGVYRYSGTGAGKRRYACYNGRKVSAFMLTFTIEEMLKVEWEVKGLLKKIRPRIRGTLSLLTLMGNLEGVFGPDRETVREELGMRINRLDRTDLVTVDYRGVNRHYLKRHLEKLCRESQAVRILDDGLCRWFYAVEVKEAGPDWGLVATEVDTGRLRIFRSEMLVHSMEDTMHREQVTAETGWDASLILGLDQPWEDAPRTVMLELIRGWQDNGDLSYLREDHFLWRKEWGKPRSMGWHGLESVPVTFDVYLNRDFFEMVWDLDRKGHLLRIWPEEVRKCYIEAIEDRIYGEYKSWEERPPRKRLNIKILE